MGFGAALALSQLPGRIACRPLISNCDIPIGFQILARQEYAVKDFARDIENDGGLGL